MAANEPGAMAVHIRDVHEGHTGFGVMVCSLCF